MWSTLPRLVRLALVCGSFLLIAGAVYVLSIVMAQLASLLIALAAAVLITALLEPVCLGLRRLRLPRWLAALIAVLLLLAAFVTPIALLIGVAAGQFSDLTARLRDGVEQLQEGASSILPISDSQMKQMLADLQDRFEFDGNPLTGALTVAEALAGIILALFVAFFLLKDGATMWGWLLDQLPARLREVWGDVGTASWETVTRYIRGILIIAVIDAIGIGIALVLIGVPFALPLALLVLVGAFVPYVGSFVSGSVAVLVALAANGPIDAALTLLAVIAVQQIEGNFLEPFIVGHQVRLHPVAIVVAVFAGALIGGIAGAIVAVPLVAAAYRAYRVLRERNAGLMAAGAGSPGTLTTESN